MVSDVTHQKKRLNNRILHSSQKLQDFDLPAVLDMKWLPFKTPAFSA